MKWGSPLLILKKSIGVANEMRALTKTGLLYFLVSLMSMQISSASFESRSRRASSAHTMLRRLHAYFDKANAIADTCTTINNDNSVFLGENEPGDGKPILKEPGPAFMTWLFTCGTAYFQDDFAHRSTEEDFERYLDSETFQALKDFATRNPATNIDTRSRLHALQFNLWIKIPSEVKQAIARNLVYEFIGPGVLENETKYITEIITFADKMPNVPLQIVVLNVVLKILLSEEFLQY